MKKPTKKTCVILGIAAAVLLAAGVMLFSVWNVKNGFSETTDSIDRYAASQRLQDAMQGDRSALFSQLTPENLNRLKSELSMADIYGIASVLRKAIPKEEYKTLLSYLSGGVSGEEVSHTLKVLQENLTPEQEQELMQYYEKYSHLLEK